ncbi:class I SAM-dependent methyltransferase [Aquimonas sp.]|jgi:SAM-dependent MidA family methyltransferase|uniref:class I SAM-dependent methyltransferase n=1 Tax=Aquimonas sp. TaxID=1872588 RepID=UPI0037C1810E
MIPLDLPEPSPEAQAHSARLRELIAAEIRANRGAIAFSRYMELALYAPGFGYYSAGATKFGAAGDFVTAPELGGLFAACIAEATAPVLRRFKGEGCFLELGGGSGAFAAAVLPALAARNALPAGYWILEPSADLRERQRERLQAELDAGIFERVRWLDRLPDDDWNGVLFANEVLDALPTTRFVMSGGEVMEQSVCLHGEAFAFCERPADMLVSAAVRHVERSLGRAFADGYTSELLPQLPYWLDAVCGALAQGLVLFVDYGYPRREFYLAEREQGTLLCHYRHRVHADPFVLPGLQDITASVDFTAVAEAGQHAGLELAGYSSQAAFLLNNGLQQHVEAGPADAVGAHRRALEAKRLILPSEMGERFQVMGLARGVDCEDQFAFGDQSHRL